jgi:hypothetical protein
VQSLILRLKTEMGELASWPSELWLPPPPADWRTEHEGNRNLIRLYVLEALRQERVRENLRTMSGPDRGARTVIVDLDLLLKAKVPDPLILVVPFRLKDRSNDLVPQPTNDCG